MLKEFISTRVMTCFLHIHVVALKGHMSIANNYNNVARASTVEPSNNGLVGTRDFVLYREVVISLEVKYVLV